MKIHYSIESFPSNINTVVTIGTFDGVHRGHKAILKRINEVASKKNLQSVILTFDPHPRQVLKPNNQNLKLINTISEKAKLLDQSLLDHLVIHKFTKEFSNLKSVNFIRDLLVNKLNMKYMIVGYNHQFGKDREGDYVNLLKFSSIYQFDIERIEAQSIGDITISSTKIRKYLHDGNILIANNLLGYSYSISNNVIGGERIGRKIGYPTANIKLEKDKLVPKCGVYAVKIIIKSNKYFGMLNIGCSNSKIEVNIFNFNKNIYNEIITVEIIKRIRCEMNFSSVQMLKKQLVKDEIFCRNFFKIDKTKIQ